MTASCGRVLSLGEKVDELTPAEAREAIERRRRLIRDMVGELWPRVLLAEVEELGGRL